MIFLPKRIILVYPWEKNQIPIYGILQNTWGALLKTVKAIQNKESLKHCQPEVA